MSHWKQKKVSKIKGLRSPRMLKRSKNVMAYSIKHPILMKGLYSQYKSLGGKRSPSSLYKGTEITNIGRILTGLYLKN